MMKAVDQPTFIICEGPSSGESYPIEKAELILGRDPSVDLLIDSPGVSRRHARLFMQGAAYLIEDLNSANGTFVNDRRITSPCPVQSGDRVKLGQSVVLLFQQPQVANTILESVAAKQQATMIEAAPGKSATLLGDSALFSAPPPPPQLTITVAGEKSSTYSLTKPNISLGRAPDNDIVIDSRIVSRHHACLEKIPGGYRLVVLPDAGNPILLEGRPVPAGRQLENGDLLRIGSLDPGMMVTITYSEAASARGEERRSIHFGDKTLIQIGRDPGNDIVLDSPNISRFHAQIERVGHRYRVRDLRSSNGTFVNDEKITQETWLNADDTIRIGRHRFVMKQDQLDRYDETRGMKVEAIGLNKWVRKDLNILQNISLSFQPSEFIVVVGQSGGGKSTLIDAIIGYRPATQGQVLINGIDVYRNFDTVRNDIGFVPQRDIIHTELTVYQALDYTARLRMPRDTTKEERHKRILEVLEDLDLVHRKDSPINKLSGGQIKRVSIGVELLTSPGLFFLDEPTSGLDPGTETAFMHLMRRLADQGRTVVMVTHATKNVMLADKVVFLARGGYLAWFGPPDQALAYFDAYRTEQERRVREMEFDQIYAILDDPSKGSAQDWAQRFAQSPAYQEYIVKPLRNTAGQPFQPAGAAPPYAKATTAKPKPQRNVSSFNQFVVLSARNLRILVRDRASLILMLLAAPLVAMLDFIIAPIMGRAPFDYNTGNGANGAITLFLMSLYCLLVAGLSQMREFVKEEDIYKRERLVNLRVIPYVSSKIWVALLLAFYHAAAYTIIHFLAFTMPGGAVEFGLVYVTMVLAAMAGMVCGLLASALAPAASSAPMIMILLLVPQIVLSGALAPVPDKVSAIASTRWAFEGLIGIVGFGSDVSADACWKLPEDQRESLTLEDKAALGCRCMGTAIFTPGSCNFPGVGKYYAPEVNMPKIEKPAALGAKPPDPVIPAAPTPPANQNDQVEMVKYLNALQAYQDQVSIIQDDYKAQMELYESQAKLYQTQMEDYQKAVLEYEAARNSAVERAEGLIGSVRDSFGWGWINKADAAAYRAWIIKVWGSQLILVGVYIAIILFLIKRKDA